jgi:hypothetical protein
VSEFFPNPPRNVSQLIGRSFTWRERWEFRFRYSGRRALARFVLQNAVFWTLALPFALPLTALVVLVDVGERFCEWARRRLDDLGMALGVAVRWVIKPVEAPWMVRPTTSFMENERAMNALKDMGLVTDQQIEEAKDR